MKKLLLILCLVMCYSAAFAQDVIIKKNGEEVNAKILEVTTDQIKYKRFDYQDGPTISILKKDVFMVKYANGTKETFAQQAPTQPTYAPGYSPDDYKSMQNVVKLAGPRVGVTLLTGSTLTKKAKDEGVSPFLTQFGWQFETRIFTTESGLSGLAEFVPLVGGLEQGEFIPSLNALMGLRTAKGFEFGVGPNLSPVGVGLVFALGTNFQTEGINFPVNLAVVPGNGGVRFSLLFGFNSRKL